MGLAAAQNGLAERRVIKDFADNHLPTLVKEIHDAVGYDVEVDIDWDSWYHQSAHSNYWIDNFKKVYFEPMVEALKSICADDMGREALQGKMKKIRYTNTDGRYRDGCSFDGDTLVFDHSPESNVDYVQERVKDIQSFLEQNL